MKVTNFAFTCYWIVVPAFGAYHKAISLLSVTVQEKKCISKALRAVRTKRPQALFACLFTGLANRVSGELV